MTVPNDHTDIHTVTISAPADTVYHRLVDVATWPSMFEPTIHAEVLAVDGDSQDIQLWAVANGEPKTWTSSRTLDPRRRSITFTQARPAAPVRSMTGTWRVVPVTATATQVTLQHTYSAIDDEPSGLTWIGRAVETNSTAELAALRGACERDRHADGAAPFTFTDHILTAADPARVFAFLDQADHWADRLDHVADAELEEFDGGLQQLAMRTRTPDGGSHVTESYRLSQPPSRLLFKQTTLPALLTLHLGEWSIRPVGELWQVTSSHTVAIAVDQVAAVLGAGATAADAAALATRNLGNNSRLTMAAAVAWAEQRDSAPAAA